MSTLLQPLLSGSAVLTSCPCQNTEQNVQKKKGGKIKDSWNAHITVQIHQNGGLSSEHLKY